MRHDSSCLPRKVSVHCCNSLYTVSHCFQRPDGYTRAHFATSQSVFVPGLLGILVEPDGFSHRLLLHTFLRHALNVLPPRHIPVSCPLVFPAPVHIFIGCGFQVVNVPQLII